MAHYRLMYPSEYLNAADLHEKDFTLTIEKIEIEDVPGTDGKKQKKPVVTLKGAKKRWVLNKTCAKTIAANYGTNTDNWVGKKVTLYPTTCQAFGHETECIRVRF